MKAYTRDVLTRAATLAQAEQSAMILTAIRPTRDWRALIAAALAALVSLYPAISAAALL